VSPPSTSFDRFRFHWGVRSDRRRRRPPPGLPPPFRARPTPSWPHSKHPPLRSAPQTAHVGALYSAFCAMMLGAGVPPMLAAITLAMNVNLFGSMTHFASGQAAAYYGSGYMQLDEVGGCGLGVDWVWSVDLLSMHVASGQAAACYGSMQVGVDTRCVSHSLHSLSRLFLRLSPHSRAPAPLTTSLALSLSPRDACHTPPYAPAIQPLPHSPRVARHTPPHRRCSKWAPSAASWASRSGAASASPSGRCWAGSKT
jgi:hypothetical protein